MKNTVTGILTYVTSIVPLEVRANTSDPARIANAAINKTEVVTGNEPTADSKEDSACGKEEPYQKVLEKIYLFGHTYEERQQVRTMLKEESSVFTAESAEKGM